VRASQNGEVRLGRQASGLFRQLSEGCMVLSEQQSGMPRKLYLQVSLAPFECATSEDRISASHSKVRDMRDACEI